MNLASLFESIYLTIQANIIVISLCGLVCFISTFWGLKVWLFGRSEKFAKIVLSLRDDYEKKAEELKKDYDLRLQVDVEKAIAETRKELERMRERCQFLENSLHERDQRFNSYLSQRKEREDEIHNKYKDQISKKNAEISDLQNTVLTAKTLLKTNENELKEMHQLIRQGDAKNTRLHFRKEVFKKALMTAVNNEVDTFNSLIKLSEQQLKKEIKAKKSIQ